MRLNTSVQKQVVPPTATYKLLTAIGSRTVVDVQTMSHQDTVLVTGASGVVGYALRSIYEDFKLPHERWIFLSSSDGDLAKHSDACRLFSQYRPTAVIHLAAQHSGLYTAMLENVHTFRENMKINENVLSCAHEFQVNKVISCMSTTCFPADVTFPTTEAALHDGLPHRAMIGYAYSKRLLDVLSRLYNDLYGSNFVCVLPCNIFGPGDKFTLKNAGVMPALINRCYMAKLEGTEFNIGGSGRARRQFLYSLDFARLLIWALRNYNDTSSPIILSPDENEELSIAEAAQVVAKAMKHDRPIAYDFTRPDGQLKKTVSNGKLRSLHPTFKFTPFEEAVTSTVEWFVSNCGQT